MKKVLKIILSFFIILFLIICIYQLIIFSKNAKKQTVLFLGDSITERYKIDKYLFTYNTINSGVGGNTTNDILVDIDNRVNAYDFDKVFLLVGINDLLYTNQSDKQIIENIDKIIDKIYKKNPNTKIYLESVYPINTNIKKDVPNNTNDKIKEFNKSLIKECDNDKCNYINMYDTLIDMNGNLKKIYTNDGIHINKFGYIIITNKLLKYIIE